MCEANVRAMISYMNYNQPHVVKLHCISDNGKSTHSLHDRGVCIVVFCVYFNAIISSAREPWLLLNTINFNCFMTSFYLYAVRLTFLLSQNRLEECVSTDHTHTLNKTKQKFNCGGRSCPARTQLRDDELRPFTFKTFALSLAYSWDRISENTKF